MWEHTRRGWLQRSTLGEDLILPWLTLLVSLFSVTLWTNLWRLISGCVGSIQSLSMSVQTYGEGRDAHESNPQRFRMESTRTRSRDLTLGAVNLQKHRGGKEQSNRDFGLSQMTKEEVIQRILSITREDLIYNGYLIILILCIFKSYTLNCIPRIHMLKF